MRRTLRMLGAVALATAAVPFLTVTPAYADASVVTAGSQGYFNAAGIDKPEQSPQAPPNPINAVDGVDKDHLAVAARNGQEDKVSALMFDLSTLGTGALVTKAELTLPLATGNMNLQSGGAPEKVRVCAAGDTGFGGEDGAAIALAPERLCKVFSSPAGKFSADKKAYVYDITKLAAQWVDGANDGLTLTAAEGALTTPFQVVFQPGAKSALAVQFTPGAPLPEDEVFTPPTDPGTGVTETPEFGGFTGGGDVPTPTDGGFGAIAAPPAPLAPAPAPGMAPTAPEPETAPASSTGPVMVESLRPTTAFWLGGLALAGMLALLSLIMGDAATTSAAAAKRPSRLANALSDRQRRTGMTRPSFGRPAAI